MNIGLLQLNFTVGDFRGNAEKILNGYRQACKQGADLVVASELALYGYPPLDLLERPDAQDAHDVALTELKAHVDEVGLILGISERHDGPGKPLFNTAIFIQHGGIQQRWHKALLPTYDVFDEARYFESGRNDVFVFEHQNQRMAMLLCEDIWGGTEVLDGPKLYPRNPVEELAKLNPDLLIVPNGSPYHWKKGNDRLTLVRRVAKQLNATVVYVNQVGGNTDLVFDGRSFVVNAPGDYVSVAPAFEESILIADTTSIPSKPYEDDSGMESLYQALILGVRDYLGKTRHQCALLGLSGGIDSALTACIAADAISPENVTAVMMPSPFSSDHSVTDSEKLVENLGIQSHQIRIDSLYEAYGQTLEPVIGWYQPGQRPGDVTEENIQARIRGNLLMAMANRTPGTLLLSTGNKSEVAMGYCTLYGDMAGGFAVLSDVWKTLVYRLAEHINREQEIIPNHILTKPPSAELRPNQKDSDSLPDYDVLDAVLQAYLEEHLSAEQILKRGLADADTIQRIIRTTNLNEFKRRQMAPGLKVTSKAFGNGRRMPIAAKF